MLWTLLSFALVEVALLSALAIWPETSVKGARSTDVLETLVGIYHYPAVVVLAIFGQPDPKLGWVVLLTLLINSSLFVAIWG